MIERGLKRIERGLEKAGGETAEVLARIDGLDRPRDGGCRR